jgi:uncharacterized protein (TIGR02145 family)
VTFNVNWDKTTMPVSLWSDSVWVFVDYNNAGKMERLPVTAATASAGTVTMAPDNNKGVWVIGNARSAGSFSATVTLLTATATATGACAYASNYPPVGEYVSDIEISFTGTLPYDIVLRHESGSTVTVQAGGTFLLPCDYVLTSFTDATTGAPGIMKCIPMTGSIDFSVPSDLSKGIAASFVVNSEPTVPNSASVTYRWAAPDFSPATYAGRTFTATVPEIAGTYPVTLIAQSEGYCDLAITKDMTVVDCHAPGSTGVTFANFSPCAGASYGATYTLTDDRDQKTYKVKYMPDGRYWMVQDLMFGNCTANSFKNDNSEAAIKVTPIVATDYVGHCFDPTTTNITYNRGYLYSWLAAINYGSNAQGLTCSGTGTLTQNCRGVCPVGWHLPSYDEFVNANAIVQNTYNCSNNDCWSHTGIWEGSMSGQYSFEYGYIGAGTGGHYWSSTGSFSGAYSWSHGTGVRGDGCYCNDGQTVRCVRNY